MVMDRQAMTDEIVKLVKPLVCALVDSPDSVQVHVTPTNTGTMFVSLEVKPDDVGKIIGREGRTANAIRTIVSAFCTKLGYRVIVDVVDPK